MSKARDFLNEADFDHEGNKEAVELGGFVFTIIDDEVHEKINVSITKNGSPIDFFTFKEGHAAFRWSNQTIAKYCLQQLSLMGEPHE